MSSLQLTLVEFFGGSALFLGAIILAINIVVFLGSLLLILFTTRNSKLLSLGQVLRASIIVSVTSSIYSFIAAPFFKSDPETSLHPILSYNFSPDAYNFVTQFIFPGIISLIVLYRLLKKYKVSNILVVSIFVTVLNLPWGLYAYRALFPANSSSSHATNISQKQKDKFARSIKFNVIKEELVIDPRLPKYKQLRIKGLLEMPVERKYNVLFTLKKSSEDTLTSAGLIEGSPYTSYVNGNSVVVTSELSLGAGKNELTFDFPYVDIREGKEIVNLIPEDYKNLSGSYGPYNFRLNIDGYLSQKGIVELNRRLEPYKTKTYSYSDFYTK